MAAKKKTTFAKLNRENKLREKRATKEMRKDARRSEAGDADDSIGVPHAHTDLTADVYVDENGRVVPVETNA